MPRPSKSGLHASISVSSRPGQADGGARRDRPSDEHDRGVDDVGLPLRERFGHGQLARAVEDHAERAVVTVLEDEHDRAVELGALKGRGGDEQPAGQREVGHHARFSQVVPVSSSDAAARGASAPRRRLVDADAVGEGEPVGQDLRRLRRAVDEPDAPHAALGPGPDLGADDDPDVRVVQGAVGVDAEPEGVPVEYVWVPSVSPAGGVSTVRTNLPSPSTSAMTPLKTLDT